jgi:hypothetical protein
VGLMIISGGGFFFFYRNFYLQHSLEDVVKVAIIIPRKIFGYKPEIKYKS